MTSLTNNPNLLSYRQAPKSIRYSEIAPLGLLATSSKVRFVPQTGPGPYTDANNTITFVLSSSTCFLDGALTYLKFDLNVTGTATKKFRLDGSASSLIKRIRISSRSGGMDLQDINEYGMLHNTLVDWTCPRSNRLGYSAISEGYGATTDNDVKCGTGEFEFVIGTTDYTSFCIPLMCLVGSSCIDKMLPLFLTGEIQVSIEVTSNGFVGDDAVCDVSIKNPELHAHLVEFKGDVNKNLRDIVMQTGAIFMHGTSWRHYSKSLGANADETILINDRLKSVKSVLITFRLPPADKTERYHSRISREMKALQIKIGDMLFPKQPIRGNGTSGTCSEFIVENMKGFGLYYHVDSGTVVNPANFISNAKGTVVACGRAAYCVDLDAFSSKEQIEAGVNMILNNPMLIEINSKATACTADVFLLYDTVFALKNDGTFTASW